MKYLMALYEKALPDEWSWSAKFEAARKGGFDGLEISVDETEERLSRLWWSPEKVAELRDISASCGMRMRTMCLSGHRKFPLGSHDPQTREKSVELLRRAVALSAELGVRVIQLAGYDVYYENGDEQTQAWFCENLTQCVEIAAAQGVCLAFETMETPFMDTVKKAMRYVERVGSPYLGIYPDIGNLKNAAVLYHGDVAEDLKEGRSHIFAAHLKETKPGVYRNLRFGEGHTEYDAPLRELWGQGVRMFTAEFWYQSGQDVQREIRRSSDFLREKIETASRE